MMKPLWLAVLILTPCVAQQAATDIAAVKAAYDKLVIANKISLLEDLIVATGNEEPAPALSFALSEFRSGPVSEILATKFAELVSKPSGLVLDSGTGTWGGSPDGVVIVPATTLRAKWRNAGYLSEDWNIPFSQALVHLPPGLDRYVSFAVRLTLDANQRTYRALFLFGSGETKAIAIDHIVGYSAVNSILAADLSVGPLILERHTRRPAVRSFLESVRGTPGCQTEPVTKLCCEGVACRLPQARVPREGVEGGHASLVNVPEMYALQPRPLAGSDPCNAYNTATQLPSVGSPVDTTGHCWGQHSATVYKSSTCTYTSPDPNNPPGSRDGCKVACHITASASVSETGYVFPLCHQAGYNNGSTDAYNHGAPCAGIAAGGVQSCVMCLCGVTFSFSGSGAGMTLSSTSAFWNFSNGGTLSCN